MGISGGPYIVRDSSLILELDAADKNSYAGSGTVWTDLTGNIISGSLISGSLKNSPTFNIANQGSFLFNGTTQIIQLQYTGSTLTTNDFSIEVWCKPNNTISLPSEATSGTGCLSGQRFITSPEPGQSTDSGVGLSVGTNGIVVAEHAASYIPSLLTATTTISSTLFSHIVIIYINKQPTAYLNGNLIKTGLTSVRTAVNLNICSIGGYVYGYFSGNAANVKFYNRSLSATEIFQNYNEQKSRFGL